MPGAMVRMLEVVLALMAYLTVVGAQLSDTSSATGPTAMSEEDATPEGMCQRLQSYMTPPVFDSCETSPFQAQACKSAWTDAAQVVKDIALRLGQSNMVEPVVVQVLAVIDRLGELTEVSWRRLLPVIVDLRRAISQLLPMTCAR